MDETGYKRLFAKSPSLVLLLRADPAYTILDATDAYLAATMIRREAIAGRPLFEVFPDNPDDPAADGTAKLRASLERAAASGKPDAMPVQKYDIRRPDGTFEERYWSPVNAPLPAADGAPACFLHRVEDVTDAVRASRAHAAMEREILRRGEDLERANRELEMFGYSVAHDLRAPLRAISGFGNALRETSLEKLDAEGRDNLERILASAKRMDGLINDLMNLSRVATEALRRDPVDLAVVARETAALFARAEAGREVALIAPMTLPVIGDPGLLRAVMQNLLGNAWKFTARVENPRVEVGSRAHEGENAYFVRDNGAGFNMTYQHKLFGPFQRLHAQSEFPGSGIGLATVRRIIIRHGGRVWAEGVPGQGATFYFTLPS